jgi:uncharacterized protein (TIGR02145 family)
VGVSEGSTATLPQNPTQGICPTGWRIPINEEWELLSLFNAEDLKCQGLWIPDIGTNSTSFNAKPAGRYFSGTDEYIGLGTYAGWWALDATPYNYAYHFFLTDDCGKILTRIINKSDGLSVRFVIEPTF